VLLIDDNPGLPYVNNTGYNFWHGNPLRGGPLRAEGFQRLRTWRREISEKKAQLDGWALAG